jgi:hypothetical protein
MTVIAELDLRVISGILVIAMYALRLGSKRSGNYDPICCCIGQAGHFFYAVEEGSSLISDEFAMAKFQAQTCAKHLHRSPAANHS